jgi:peptidyl-prolyl cis-trans isomerase B (cyclophilin B)
VNQVDGMIKSIVCFLLLVNATLYSAVTTATEWVIQTNLGNIHVELFEKKAPLTTAHIKTLTEEGFYNRTRFHRLIPGYVLQGGGYSKYLARKTISQTLTSEANNGLKNTQYTVAMARGQDKHSASSQFFFNLNDNSNLDHRNNTDKGYGYTVFGKVTSGAEVLEKIEQIETEENENFSDFPVEMIIIERAFLK